MADVINEVMEQFDMSPYENHLISEEEFVYDSLNNQTLFKILNASSSSAFWVEDNDAMANWEEGDQPLPKLSVTSE